MTVQSLRARQLVVTVDAGQLMHPIPDDVDVCEVIRRLAPIVPETATWTVRPPES